MTRILVSPLSQLAAMAEKYQPHDMITLINAGTPVIRPAIISESRHLCLYFNDVNEECEGLVAPAEEHVAAILRFVESWKQTAPLLIHCFMGISRSTAAAFITACALNPDMKEKRLAIHLREKAPSATPNARLVSLADHLLGRQGRMNDAIKQIGRGCDAREGSPFVLDFQGEFNDVKIKI